jgi:hypothetical protein
MFDDTGPTEVCIILGKIPSQSEIVVNGKVNDRFPILFKVGLVEPTEDFRKSDKALVGRTLVKTNKDIPLRLMNVSSQPKTLYEGTVIAKEAQ